MIPIKNEKEIEIMRQAGQILSGVIKKIVPHICRGVSTLELDQLAEKLIYQAGAKPGFKGYGKKKDPYPSTLCTSINEEVVHTIPRKDRILKDGDIIGLDCGVKYKEYYSDMAITIAVGKIPYKTQELIKTTKGALDMAIKNIREGVYLGDISNLIQSFIEKKGFSVVRQLSGHGIGKELHQEPTILNYGKKGTGPILKSGMVLAFEPMVNIGSWQIKTLKDGWTIVTEDGSLSAHFEHTILVTKQGAEVLTKM